MQIEEATQGATNRPCKRGSEGEKPKQQFPLRKNSKYNSVAVHKPPERARVEPGWHYRA